MANLFHSGIRFLAIIFNIVTFISCLLLLLAGVNNISMNLFYLKTDMSNFNLPANLAGSQILRELSTVSGKDFTGPDVTASSLGLAQTYTINLLTTCALGSTTVCSQPRVGYKFSPGSDLLFDSTSLRETYSVDYLAALATYNRIAPFLSGAYIVAAALSILTIVMTCFSSRKFIIAGTLLSGIKTILLLAAAVTATNTFRNLAFQINTSFSSSGLTASTGNIAWELGYGMFAASLIITILLSICACYAPHGKAPGHRSIAGKINGAIVTGTSGEEQMFGNKGHKKSFLASVPMFSRHKYMQIQKQPAVRAREASAAGDGQQLDERMDDWAAGDDYATVGNENIAMRNMAVNTRSHNVNTAYEPFTRT